MGKLELPIIGRTLLVHIEGDKHLQNIPARVDTGAYTSAIWASNISERDGELSFVLFDKKSPFYTGKVYHTRTFRTIEVISSFGDRQVRYAIELEIELPRHKSGVVQAAFTLADRSKKRYPVLIGREFLLGRYLVDVRLSDDTPVKDEEETNKKQVDEEEGGQ